MKYTKKISWNIDDKFEFTKPIVRNIFFEKKLKMRKPFCEWIEKISYKYTNDLDWWLALPSSRNPYLSDLFDSICILETLKELLKKNYSIYLKTSCKELFQILEETKFEKKKNLKIFFHKKKDSFNMLAIFKTITFYSILFFYIKFFSKKKCLLKNKNYILVETYSLINFKNKESLNRNIFKYNKNKMLLVPNFLQQKNLKMIFKKIKSLDQSKYLFRENYLTIFDLVLSILHIYRKKKFISKYKKFNNWDLSSIINSEINSTKNYYSAVLGIANYRFFKNLSKKKVYISKIIGLFENQAVGRGWCYGSRNFFPKAENIGYQGYFNFSQFLSSHPCEYEENSKILPKKIAVISKYFKKNKKEFFAKAKIIVSLPLNIKFDQKNLIKKDKYTITLILNGIKEIDKKLIYWCIKFLEINKKVKLVVKFHPIRHLDIHDLNLIKNYNGRIKVLNQDIGSVLDKSKIIISTGPTSSLYEAFFKKCYVLIPIFDPWDKLNIENCKIPKQNYELAINFQEFRFKLDNMLINIDKKKFKKLKYDFFFKKNNSKILNIFK